MTNGIRGIRQPIMGGSVLGRIGSTKGAVVSIPMSALGRQVMAASPPGTLFGQVADGYTVANITGVPNTPSGISESALLDYVFGNVQGDMLYRDAATWKVLAPGTAGYLLSTGGAGANPSWIIAPAGSVTSVSVVSANGLAGTVATATTTPAITLTTTITGILQGNGTAISAISSTGSGSVVLDTNAVLTTPALGTPSALVGTNITGTGAAFTAGNATKLTTGRTISITGDLAYTSGSFDGSGNVTGTGTLATVATAGTTGSSTAIPVITIDVKGRTTGITTAAVVAPAGTLTGTTLASGVTGSSLTSFGNSPTFVTPLLGTPTSGTLTSCTGLPLTTGITGTLGVGNGGTGVTGAAVGNGASVVLGTASAAYTPTLAFGGGATLLTYTTQSGKWSKDGARIFFDLRITLSNKGVSTGTVTIVLPVAVKAGISASITVGFADAMAATVVSAITGFANAGTTDLYLYHLLAGTGTALSNSDFTNTTDLAISGSYEY